MAWKSTRDSVSSTSENFPKIIAACQTNPSSIITKSSISGLYLVNHIREVDSTVIGKNFYTGTSGEAFELFSSYDHVIAQATNGENDNTLAIINLTYTDENGYGFRVFSIDNAYYPEVSGEDGYSWDPQWLNLTFIGYNNAL